MGLSFDALQLPVALSSEHVQISLQISWHQRRDFVPDLRARNASGRRS